MSQREEKKRKRKCVFHGEYSEEFKFIKPGKNCYEASCELCNSSFTIGSGWSTIFWVTFVIIIKRIGELFSFYFSILWYDIFSCK